MREGEEGVRARGGWRGEHEELAVGDHLGDRDGGERAGGGGEGCVREAVEGEGGGGRGERGMKNVRVGRERE